MALAFGLAAVPLLAAPATSYADPFDKACSAGGGGSAVCHDKGTTTNPLTGGDGVLTKVSNVLALAGGIITVIMVLVGGFKYITSNGDSSATASAKNTIIYGLVGMIVIVLARGIVSFVITKI